MIQKLPEVLDFGGDQVLLMTLVVGSNWRAHVHVYTYKALIKIHSFINLI